jgi:hypothetical protein
MVLSSLSCPWGCFYHCVSTHWWLTIYRAHCPVHEAASTAVYPLTDDSPYTELTVLSMRLLLQLCIHSLITHHVPSSLSCPWGCFYRCVSTHWWLTIYLAHCPVHEAASAAVYPLTDDSPYTIHYTRGRTLYHNACIFTTIFLMMDLLRLETCKRYCAKLNYSRCALGCFYIVIVVSHFYLLFVFPPSQPIVVVFSTAR